MGTIRLINQIAVFALLVTALRESSNQETKRGIYQDLNAVFDFPGLQGLGSRDGFRGTMHLVATNSKQFFPLSGKIFDTKSRGTVQLQGSMETFTRPKLGKQINFGTESFTMTAWVRTVPQFLEGYILRKRPEPGSTLSCVGWNLHATKGPALHYGAHDFDPREGPWTSSSSSQYECRLKDDKPFEPGSFTMLTLVVYQTHAVFFKNIEMTGNATLPRASVTDCFNGGEGTLVGDPGLELGVVRYWPYALSITNIEEIFRQGGTLSDLSTGSEPEYGEDSEIGVIGRALGEGVTKVDIAVGGREEKTQINVILQSGKDNPPPPTVRSPAAPFGQIAANPTPINDGTHTYTSLFLGPGLLTSSAGRPVTDHRTITGAPGFSGTGATFTYWARFNNKWSGHGSIGMYILQKHTTGREYCWDIYHEPSAYWFENSNCEPEGGAAGCTANRYPEKFTPAKFNLEGDLIWRHIALVYDETTDNYRLYYDGSLAYEGWHGSKVRLSDCNGAGTELTFGHDKGAWSWADEIEIYDLRMYVHTFGSPMQDSDIARIAFEPTPAAASNVFLNAKCLHVTDPAMEDKEFKDVFGNACDWYHKNRKKFPKLCAGAEVQSNCPQSCQSKFECFSNVVHPKAYFVWDRIKKLEPKHVNGTICLSSKKNQAGISDPVKDATKVVEACRAYWRERKDDLTTSWSDRMKADVDAKQWMESYAGLAFEMKGRRVNVTDCDELAAAIDPDCSYDGDIVEEFTAAMNAGKGASPGFTLAFWAKPTGLQSINERYNLFNPAVTFFSKVSPPQHNLALGLWGSGHFGEVRIESSCDWGSVTSFESVIVPGSGFSKDEWSFIVMSRSSATFGIETGYNLNKIFDGGKWLNKGLCLFDPTAFFTAMEISYPMLMSPIMLIPEKIPFSSAQQAYLKASAQMAKRAGPRLTARAMMEEKVIPVEKQDYTPRSVLIAPPIVFQTKRSKADACPSKYSSTFITQQFNRMNSSKCQEPFQCDAELLKKPELLFSCPGEIMNMTSFGIDSTEFQGVTGYADFLFSLTDSPFLFRDGQVKSTEEFIDADTDTARILLVFFTPSAGITTVLTISAHFMGAAAAELITQLNHYEMLEGEKLTSYVVVQSVVLVFVVFIIIDSLVELKKVVADYRRHKQMGQAGHEASFDHSAFFKIVLDLAACGMTIAFIAMRIPTKLNSLDSTSTLVGELGQLPWESTDMTLTEKTKLFFNGPVDNSGSRKTGLTQLISLIDVDSRLDSFCSLILFVSLLRVIQCTALHPRLALLTGTISKALDDLFHASLLILLLMCTFAAIATWRFGTERADFATFEVSLLSNFMMMFGNFPEDWAGMEFATPLRTELIVYVVLYFLVVFLLMQNFLLAIVVEAYMQVAEENKVMETEQDFVSDLCACFTARFKSIKHGWPNSKFLGKVLDEWNGRLSVGFKDLERTQLFKSQVSIGHFIQYYSNFEFCDPPVISKIGIVVGREDNEEELHRMSTVLENLLHKFHHGRVPKLKDIAKDGIAKAIERRAKKEGPSGVQHLLGLLGETTVPALAACPLQQAATARALDNKLPEPLPSIEVMKESPTSSPAPQMLQRHEVRSDRAKISSHWLADQVQEQVPRAAPCAPFVGAALNGGWSGDAVTALPLGWEGKDENLIEDTNWGS